MAFQFAGFYGKDNLLRTSGAPLQPGAEIAVYEPGTVTLATLYADRDRSSTVANPRAVETLGNFGFFAEPGPYELDYGYGRIKVVAVPDRADTDGVFGVRTRSTATVPFIRDDFDRADGPLGPDWIDGHDVLPDVYDPLGIFDGDLVCTDPFTRSGTYDTTPPSGHPPTGGRLHPGIGCAWRETGSKRVRVAGRWSGIVGNATDRQIEFAPLIHVVPGHPLHGFGIWMSEVFGATCILAGYICNPPEDFTGNVFATSFVPGDPVTDTPLTIELVSNGDGTALAYLEGSSTPITWNYQAGGSGTVLTIDPELADSTLHGFAVDAHYTTPALIPELPAAEWVEVEALGDGAALPRQLGSVPNRAEIHVEDNIGARWRFFEDGVGNTALGLFADDDDTQPRLSLGLVVGTPYVFAGPGGSTVPTPVFELAAGQLATRVDTLFKPAGSTAVWRVKDDGGGVPLIGLYADDDDTQPQLAFGKVFGVTAILAGPGGATPGQLVAFVTSTGIQFQAAVPLTARILPRVTAIASNATPAVNTDNTDMVNITALAVAITSMTSGLTGTPQNFQTLSYRIKDNGTGRAIAWGAKFVAGTFPLPVTTVANKVTEVDFRYDTVPALWRCVNVYQEP